MLANMIKLTKMGNTEGTNTPAYFDNVGNEKMFHDIDNLGLYC